MIWKSKKGKKKRKIKEKIYYISLFAVTLLLLFIAGSVFKLNKRVIVPVVSKVFTDKDDTTIEMNGSQNAISVVLNDPKFNGGSSNDDNSSADDNNGNNGGNGTLPDTNVDTADIQAVKKAVYKFLTQTRGYDNYIAAGVMGNVECESHFKVGSTESHSHDDSTNEQCIARGCTEPTSNKAHGLCQWDSGRRVKLINGAKDSGKEWASLEYQLIFWDSELKEGGEKHIVDTRMKEYHGYDNSYDKVEYFTWYYGCYFEVPANDGTSYRSFDARSHMSNWSERLLAAQDIYKEIIAGSFN